MKELAGLARKHAEEYFRGQGLTLCDQNDCRRNSLSDSSPGVSNDASCCQSSASQLDSVVETYRMLIIPDKTLTMYFRSFGKEELKREFKRLVLLIHPDKNSHPSAKLAFQKMYNNFMAVSQLNN